MFEDFSKSPEVKMIKKAILLGRKKGAGKALRFLLHRGIEVPFVIVDPNENGPESLRAIANLFHIKPYDSDAFLYSMLKTDTYPAVENVDLVISYLYNRKIRKPLFELGRLGCVNFHPAPLPDYKSSAGYNTAILEQKDRFGVSAHFIDSEQFDSGPIIKVNRFPINPAEETALSLERKTQEKLFELFTEVMADFLEEKPITTLANSGGTYWTKKELEKLRTIHLESDSLEEIDRKIRAFFFPPYHGATITIHGQEFTLLNQEVLKYLATLIHK